jgi:hypothetical protein
MHWYRIQQIHKGVPFEEVCRLLEIPEQDRWVRADDPYAIIFIDGRRRSPDEWTLERPRGELQIWLNPDRTVSDMWWTPGGEFSIDQWQYWLNRWGF